MTQPSPLPHVDKCALISEPYCCSVATKEAKKRIKLFPRLVEALENAHGYSEKNSKIHLQAYPDCRYCALLKETRGAK